MAIPPRHHFVIFFTDVMMAPQDEGNRNRSVAGVAQIRVT